MFTLLVSWLLVLCVPGLLMLAALGLGRLERLLGHEAVTVRDVDDFLEQAEAVDMHTLAREGLPEALDYLHRRQSEQHARVSSEARNVDGAGEQELPPPIYRHLRPNPQYIATRRVNGV